nr:MAG TPA: hypothetical protein [Caudoviricetes sp.]
MKLIEEGQLVHVDNMDDVLLHFGTKGMKWGVRKAARAAVNVGKIYANSYTHPFLTTHARNKTNWQHYLDKKKYKADKKKLKAEYANLENKNSAARDAALKKLKANYKKNNSATGLLERQVRNLEKNKAAKAQYKKEKANATTKMEKSKAKTKYKRAINPLSY